MISKLNNNINSQKQEKQDEVVNHTYIHTNLNQNTAIQLVTERDEKDNQNINVEETQIIKPFSNILIDSCNQSEISFSEENELLNEYYQDISIDEDSLLPDKNFTSQLNEAFDYLHYGIFREMERIKEEKDKIIYDKDEFAKAFYEKKGLFSKDLHHKTETERILYENILHNSNEILEIELIEQKKLLTSVKTLTKQANSKLSKLITEIVGVKIKPDWKMKITSQSFNRKSSGNSLVGSNNSSQNVKYSFNLLNQVNTNKNTSSYSNLIIPQKVNGKLFINRKYENFLMLVNYLRTEKIPYFEDEYQEECFNEECDFWEIEFNKNSK